MKMMYLRLYKQTKHKLLSKQHTASSNNWISQQEYVTETAIQQQNLQKLCYFLEQKYKGTEENLDKVTEAVWSNHRATYSAL